MEIQHSVGVTEVFHIRKRLLVRGTKEIVGYIVFGRIKMNAAWTNMIKNVVEKETIMYLATVQRTVPEKVRDGRESRE